MWRATASCRGAVRLGLGAVVGAGIALATVPAGGATRTSGTYDRFARSADLADVVVDGGDDSGAVLDAIADLPDVVDSARVTGLGLVALGSPSAMSLPAPGQQLLVSDERFGTVVNSFVLLDGTAARPDRLEAVVSERWSARFGTRVGDEVQLTLPILEDGLDGFEEIAAAVASGSADSVTTTVHISGVVLNAKEVAPDEQDRDAELIASPAVAAALTVPAGIDYGLLYVELEPDTDITEFLGTTAALVERMAAVDPSVEVSLYDVRRDHDRATRATAPYVTALWILSGLGALVGLVLAIPAILRQAIADRGDDVTLNALGMGPRGRNRLAVLRLAPSALTAALVAVGVTVASSRWFPVGPAAPFEPHPGIRLDVPLLVIGALIGLVIVPALAIAAPHLLHRARPTFGRRRGLTDHLTARSSSVPLVVGARLALPGPGRRDVAMRISLVMLTGLLAITTAVVWVTAGVDRLANDAQRRGWGWDVTVINGFGYNELPLVQTDQLLDGAGAVAWSYLRFSQLETADRSFPVFGVEPRRGAVAFELLEGRMPTGPDEIALGTATMRELGTSINHRVSVGGRTARRDATVVGRVVLPALAPTDGVRPRLGAGAVLSNEGLDARDGPGFPTVAIVRARPGEAGRLAASVVERLGPTTTVEVMRTPMASELRLWEDGLHQTPLIAVGATVVLTGCLLMHALLHAARRARRDRAVLRVVGTTPAQVHHTLLVQALLLVATAIVVGVPIGALVGTIAWQRVASALGVAGDGVWPAMLMLVLVTSTIVVAVVVALVCRFGSTRDGPAAVLRLDQ
jgi:hypothetical protein